MPSRLPSPTEIAQELSELPRCIHDGPRPHGPLPLLLIGLTVVTGLVAPIP